MVMASKMIPMSQAVGKLTVNYIPGPGMITVTKKRLFVPQRVKEFYLDEDSQAPEVHAEAVKWAEENQPE